MEFDYPIVFYTLIAGIVLAASMYSPPSPPPRIEQLLVMTASAAEHPGSLIVVLTYLPPGASVEFQGSVIRLRGVRVPASVSTLYRVRGLGVSTGVAIAISFYAYGSVGPGMCKVKIESKPTSSGVEVRVTPLRCVAPPRG